MDLSSEEAADVRGPREGTAFGPERPNDRAPTSGRRTIPNGKATRDPVVGPRDRTALVGSAREENCAGLAVILLDFDALRRFNRSHGYTAGDRLLRKAASRLTRALPANGRLAWEAGGRFMILLSDVSDLDQVSSLVEHLFAVAGRPYRSGKMDVRIEASIGVALRPWHGIRLDDLANRATLALAEAKRSGGGCCRLFEESMHPTPSLGTLPGIEVAYGWAGGEFRLFYQPQVSIPDRALVGAEALLRWHHPQRGVLSPASFLEHIESDRTLASEVGRWVLDQACRDLAQWRSQGIDMPRVAVNLSQEHLRQGQLHLHVEAALAASGLQPGDLELEVTERIALDAELIDALRSLGNVGVQIALDDFGTGFAGLATLRKLPLSCLKIDRSFVSDLQEGSADLAVVRAVLSLGDDLGLRVIAEGVEDMDQVARLADIGCRFFQGYLFGEPVPPENFEGQIPSP